MCSLISSVLFFFFNDTATTEIYTLSLHDALPILTLSTPLNGSAPSTGISTHTRRQSSPSYGIAASDTSPIASLRDGSRRDRKSTRLNSSHANISYAVFCLKKKKQYCPMRICTTED